MKTLPKIYKTKRTKQITDTTTSHKITKSKNKKSKKKITFFDLSIGLDIKEVRNDFKPKSHNVDKALDELLSFSYFKDFNKVFYPAWATNLLKSLPKKEVLDIKYTKIKKARTPMDVCDSMFTDLLYEIVNQKPLSSIKRFLTKKAVHEFYTSKGKNPYIAFNISFFSQFLNDTQTEYYLEQTLRGIRVDKNHYFFKYMSKNKKDFNTIDEIKEVLDFLSHSSYLAHVEKRENRKSFDSFTKHFFIDDKLIDTEMLFNMSHKKIVRLTKEWHIMQSMKGEGKLIAWDKRIDDLSIGDYSFEEIVDSLELSKEGKALKHCVSSYAKKASSGRTSIVSMKNFNSRKITLEICDGNIIQAKGKSNRDATDSEMFAIKKYAQEKNLGLYL